MPRMSGTERQPSHPSSISAMRGVTTGSIRTVNGTFGASGYRGLPFTSITQTCFKTWTWLAASPAPLYSRMVSTMSSINRWFSGDRISLMGIGSATLRSAGCPSRATLRMAIVSTCGRIVPRPLPSPLRTRGVRSCLLPLRPVAVRLVLLEIAEQGVHVRRRVPEVEVFGLDEALVDAPLDLRPERIEVAVEVEDNDWLGMVAELLQRQRLEHFLESAESPGQRDEGLAPLIHDGLPVAEAVGHDQLCHVLVPDAQIEQRLGNHTGHLAAVLQHRA